MGMSRLRRKIALSQQARLLRQKWAEEERVASEKFLTERQNRRNILWTLMSQPAYRSKLEEKNPGITQGWEEWAQPDWGRADETDEMIATDLEETVKKRSALWRIMYDEATMIEQRKRKEDIEWARDEAALQQAARRRFSV